VFLLAACGLLLLVLEEGSSEPKAVGHIEGASGRQARSAVWPARWANLYIKRLLVGPYRVLRVGCFHDV
jgi:hypothetical protein